MQENRDNRIGVVYSKFTKPWASSKGESYYIVLEHTEQTTKKFRDKTDGSTRERYGAETNFIVFKLGLGIGIDDYAIGDFIDVRYKIRGIKYQKKDGTGEGFFNELEATYIKPADIDTKKDTPNNYPSYKASEIKDKVFLPPDPDAQDDTSDLPF